MKKIHLSLVVLCLCSFSISCSDDDEAPQPDTMVAEDSGPQPDIAATVDSMAPADTAATGTELCAMKTVALVQGREADILEARLCYRADQPCQIVSGDGANDPCEGGQLAVRWGRNEGVSPANSFLDTTPNQTIEDATHGAGGAFNLNGFPLDTEVGITVVLATTPPTRLRVPFTMTATDVSVGPVLEL